MTTHDVETLVDADAVAAYLGVKRRTVYAMSNDGDLPHFKVGGQFRYRLSEVEAWVVERRRNGTKGSA